MNVVFCNFKFPIGLVILIVLFDGCSNVEQPNGNKKAIVKTAIELEDSSIKSGLRIDTLGRYIFGMTKEEVYLRSKFLESHNEIILQKDSSILYKFQTPSFYLYNLVEFYYENGKLFRTVEMVLPEKNESKKNSSTDFRTEVLNDTKKNYGNNPHTNGIQNSNFYWLKGNLRVDYMDTNGTSVVAYSDMSVERLIREANKKKECLTSTLQKQEEQTVIEKLKAKAKQDWPDDYTTQEFWIREEIDAYHYMKSIPDDNIKRKAQNDWPLDFTTQKFWHKQQIEAKDRLK